MSRGPSVSGSLLVGTASTLREIIAVSYGVRDEQISSGPNWLASDRYDLEARTETGAPLTRDRAMVMLRILLAERFQLEIHRESKETPFYELVLANNGPKFKPSAPDAKGSWFARGVASGQIHMEALRGNPADGAADPNSNTPSVFTAVQEQLGLKLNPAKDPIEMLVIDHAEKPGEN